jgi:hypothetical protein
MPVGALACLSARNLLRNLLALVLRTFRGSRFMRDPRFVFERSQPASQLARSGVIAPEGAAAAATAMKTSARNLLRNLLAVVLGRDLAALATCFATCSLWC